MKSFGKRDGHVANNTAEDHETNEKRIPTTRARSERSSQRSLSPRLHKVALVSQPVVCERLH